MGTKVKECDRLCGWKCHPPITDFIGKMLLIPGLRSAEEKRETELVSSKNCASRNKGEMPFTEGSITIGEKGNWIHWFQQQNRLRQLAIRKGPWIAVGVLPHWNKGAYQHQSCVLIIQVHLHLFAIQIFHTPITNKVLPFQFSCIELASRGWSILLLLNHIYADDDNKDGIVTQISRFR